MTENNKRNNWIQNSIHFTLNRNVAAQSKQYSIKHISNGSISDNDRQATLN